VAHIPERVIRRPEQHLYMKDKDNLMDNLLNIGHLPGEASRNQLPALPALYNELDSLTAVEFVERASCQASDSQTTPEITVVDADVSLPAIAYDNPTYRRLLLLDNYYA
jgi:hypothetical protein